MKYMTEIEKLGRKYGYVLERHRNKHAKLHAKGKATVYVSCTPKDEVIALRNIETDLMKGKKRYEAGMAARQPDKPRGR